MNKVLLDMGHPGVGQSRMGDGIKCTDFGLGVGRSPGSAECQLSDLGWVG